MKTKPLTFRQRVLGLAAGHEDEAVALIFAELQSTKVFRFPGWAITKPDGRRRMAAVKVVADLEYAARRAANLDAPAPRQGRMSSRSGSAQPAGLKWAKKATSGFARATLPPPHDDR